MDEFLSKLDINPNADLDELPLQIARVLSFMQIDQFLQPDAKQVRMFLRSALFVYANLEIHGQALEQRLNECQQIPKNELNSMLAKFHDKSLMDDVCEKLLMTTTGPNYILEIQDFCNDFLEPGRFGNILRRVQNIRSSASNINQVAAEAKFLIRNIFHLESSNDIDKAIKSLIDKVQFNILAWIINFDEQHTYFSMKCSIVQKEIYSNLRNGSICENFIASMYEISSLDDNGLRIYLKCLQNKMFATSLMIFFINYLSVMEDKHVNVENSKNNKYDPMHVSFLIAVMLSNKSEHRIEFHKNLAAMQVSANVLLSISHLNFIYSI